MAHKHVYMWFLEPEGVQWVAGGRCYCGHEDWQCTARTNDELQRELAHAFRTKQIGAVSYYKGPILYPGMA